MVVILSSVFISACSSSAQATIPAPTVKPTNAPTPTVGKPIVPEVFKTQLMSFLEKGAKVNALTSQGVTYVELRQAVADMKASYDLVDSTWPSDFSTESRKNTQLAFNGWDMALALWKMKIDESDNPVEPDVNGYKRFLAYEGDQVVLETHPQNFIVKDYRGKKFLPFDENISILLTIAGKYYDKAKVQLLEALQ
jgi:hypothetical protein